MRQNLKYGFPILALIAVIGGWSVVWKLASTATEAALDDWFAQERANGRVWTCGSRVLRGYPFRIDVRCSKPTFASVIAGNRVEGSVGDIDAGASVAQPSLVAADIQSPLRVEILPGRAHLTAEWARLRLVYKGGDGALQLGALEAADVAVKGRAPAISEFLLAAAAVKLDIQPNKAQPTSLDAALDASGIASPILDNLLASDGAANISITATASRMDAVAHPSNAQPAERWRRAGGELEVTKFHLEKGELDIAAKGTGGIDESHRLRGRFDLAASGLTSLLEKFGIPTGLLAIGNLLGGAAAGQDALGKPGATRVVLKMDTGRASIGPARLPFPLAPLY